MMLLFLSNFLRLFQVQFRNHNLENIMQDCHNFTRESKTTSWTRQPEYLRWSKAVFILFLYRLKK